MNTRTQISDHLPANSGRREVQIQLVQVLDITKAAELLKEVVECLLQNTSRQKTVTKRDITNCTIGFQTLARETGIMEKSLMRMLSVKGNPQAKNLFAIIDALQRLNGFQLEVRAV